MHTPYSQAQHPYATASLAGLLKALVLIHCNGTPGPHSVSKRTPPSIRCSCAPTSTAESKRRTYEIIRQPETPPAQPTSHLRKPLRLNQMIERKRWEHSPVAMHLRFHQQRSPSYAVEVDFSSRVSGRNCAAQNVSMSPHTKGRAGGGKTVPAM